LCNDRVYEVRTNGVSYKNYSVFQQSRINIVDSFSVFAFFDNGWDEYHEGYIGNKKSIYISFYIFYVVYFNLNFHYKILPFLL